MSTSKKWLLLQVKASQEKRAIDNLEYQGADCYCPMISLEKVVSGKRKTVEEALFPGYVFVNSDPERDGLSYTTLRSTRGVQKVVSFGQNPVAVPEILIDQLKRRELLHNDRDRLSVAPIKGDKLRVFAGPFKGLEAVFSESDGSMRSVIMISMLHKEVMVTVSNTALDMSKTV